MGRTLRVLSDYGSHALWTWESDSYLNIAPKDLPIPVSLAESLEEWSDKYDRTLNDADPISSGFESEADEVAFVGEGRVLAGQLKAALGDEWSVTYYDQRSGEDVDIS